MANPASQHAVLVANYRARMVAHLLTFAVAFASEWWRSRDAVFWVPFIVITFGWPHLARALARRAQSARRAEFRTVMVDAACAGMLAAALRFALWPAVAVLLPCYTVIFRAGGWRALGAAAATSLLGAGIGVALYGFTFEPQSDVLTSALSIVLLVGFTLNFAAVARWQGGALRKGKRALDVALEHQRAISEVLHAITATRADLDAVFSTIITNAVRLCGGLAGGVYRFDGTLIHRAAHVNYSAEALDAMRRAFPIPPMRDSIVGRAILERAVIDIADIEAEGSARMTRLARLVGFRSMLVAPMLRGGEPIGVIAVNRREVGGFSVTEAELLKMFSAQATVAIENAQLFTELDARNAELTAALDRQTATSETLRAITESPTDDQRVFNAIVAHVKRLLGAHTVVLMRLEGEQVHCAAYTRTNEAADARFLAWFPGPLSGLSVLLQAAMREGQASFVTDVETDSRISPAVLKMSRARGYRSLLTVPIVREERVIGAITATRAEPGAFDEQAVALLETFADQAAIAIENVRLVHELAEKKSQLERELASAHDIQLSMVPVDFPVPGPGRPVELHATLLPARQVGGDLYDFFWRDPATLYFVVADVSDKGAPAALFMARAKTLIRSVATLVAGEDDAAVLPHEVIARVNQELCQDNPFAMFVTIFLGRLRPATGELVFCNAGHNVPYVVGPGGDVGPLRGAGGKPVGIDASFAYASTTAHLAAGDCLFVYTDGIPESLDASGAFYEDARLEATLRDLAGRSPRDVVAGVVESVRRFAGDRPPADDIAAMALRRATAVAVEVTVTTRPGDLERVVHAVDELGAVHGLPRDLVADVNVALDEVLDNIVRYAYRDEGRYEIRVRIVPSANHLDVEVEDDGIPFDPTTAPVTPVNGGSVRDRAAGGLGLRFVRHLMDEVTYERVGTRNRLRLRKRLRPATRPTIF